jgi:predicted DNA-binding antitoxin AbrB/MazE fold protein
MATSIDAVYEHGVLRPIEPMALAEGTHVKVIVIPDEAPLHTETPADILSAIAALPMEPGGKEFDGRQHDEVLYGKPDPS